MNLHYFPYFDPTKKSAKKYYKFQRHSLSTALHKKKSAHAHNVFFGFGFWASLVDEIKNIKSTTFARYHRILNFLGHPNVYIVDVTEVVKKPCMYEIKVI